MRYRDIAADRFVLPASHPHLAEFTIDPVDWCKFQRLHDDNPAVRILGHDEPRDEQMTVYVACASRETRNRLEDGWG
jgi:hypothetical protein